MFAKIIVVALLLVIFYCLGSALFYMLSRGKNPETMVKALTWRVALSIILFVLLMFGFYMGWIQPHGI